MSRLRSIDWLTVRRRHIHSISRQLHFEQLEERQFLSISPWSAVEHSAISLTKQTYFAAADFDAYTLNSQQLEVSLGAPAGSVAMGGDAPSPKQIALPN